MGGMWLLTCVLVQIAAWSHKSFTMVRVSEPCVCVNGVISTHLWSAYLRKFQIPRYGLRNAS